MAHVYTATLKIIPGPDANPDNQTVELVGTVDGIPVSITLSYKDLRLALTTSVAALQTLLAGKMLQAVGNDPQNLAGFVLNVTQ